MKLSLAALKVHLMHCANIPRLGRSFGLAFTLDGMPTVAAVPHLK